MIQQKFPCSLFSLIMSVTESKGWLVLATQKSLGQLHVHRIIRAVQWSKLVKIRQAVYQTQHKSVVSKQRMTE